MPLILGLLTTGCVVAAAAAVVALTGWSPHSLCLFFIIPVGGLLAGAGCGAGVFVGVLVGRARARARHFLLAGTLAGAAMPGIYYALYANSYLTPDMQLNYRGHGQHISQFAFQGSEEPIHFGSYLRQTVTSRETSFYVGAGRRGRGAVFPVGSAQMGSFYNWAKFGLEELGFLLGGMIVGAFILPNKRYCDRCRRYTTQQLLFRLRPADLERKLPELNLALVSGAALRDFAQSNVNAAGDESQIQGWVNYCPDCFDGLLVLIGMRKTSEGFQEVSECRQTVPLDPAAVREVVGCQVDGLARNGF